MTIAVTVPVQVTTAQQLDEDGFEGTWQAFAQTAGDGTGGFLTWTLNLPYASFMKQNDVTIESIFSYVAIGTPVDTFLVYVEAMLGLSPPYTANGIAAYGGTYATTTMGTGIYPQNPHWGFP